MSHQKKHFLTVIIPVYNESKRLGNLPKIVRYLSKLPVAAQLLVVNDGSTDDTLEKLEKYAKKHQFHLISYPVNKGKGHAVSTGMLAAKGKWRLFMDLDLSVPLEYIEVFLKQTDQADVLIGTRRLKKSKITTSQSQVREWLGQIFTKISQIWLRLPISDFTCGFKFFSAAAAEDIFSRLHVERWGFDPEILFVANHRQWKIKEIPVTWKNDPRSKVKFPQDIIQSIHDLGMIKYRHWKKSY